MFKKIKIKGFVLAAGLSMALFLFFLAVFAMYFDWGTEVVNLIGTVYKGYTSNWGGAVIGGIWAFVDIGIGAAIFAFIYNKLS